MLSAVPYIYGNCTWGFKIALNVSSWDLAESWRHVSNRFETWQVSQQHCCRGAWQISKRSGHFSTRSRTIDTLRDRTIRHLMRYWIGPLHGPPRLFTKRYDVLPPNLAKSRSLKIGCYNDRIALKFDRHLGRSYTIRRKPSAETVLSTELDKSPNFTGNKDFVYQYHFYRLTWGHYSKSLRWRHNRPDSVSNRQPHDCLLYGPCMIVPHKWTKICWLATAN